MTAFRNLKILLNGFSTILYVVKLRCPNKGYWQIWLFFFFFKNDDRMNLNDTTEFRDENDVSRRNSSQILDIFAYYGAP
jgi:hypothetical protein